jgi:hypothetical protein
MSTTVDDSPYLPVRLETPCWWIDRADCEEITHHPTLDDAVAHHRDLVCSEYGWVLSATGAFALVPGQIQQEQRCCWQVICPDCGRGLHLQDRYEECFECGYPYLIEDLPGPDDEHQETLFDVLDTTGVDGAPPYVIVMVASGGDV